MAILINQASTCSTTKSPSTPTPTALESPIKMKTTSRRALTTLRRKSCLQAAKRRIRRSHGLSSQRSKAVLTSALWRGNDKTWSAKGMRWTVTRPRTRISMAAIRSWSMRAVARWAVMRTTVLWRLTKRTSGRIIVTLVAICMISPSRVSRLMMTTVKWERRWWRMRTLSL